MSGAPLERNKVFKYSAVAAFALVLSTAPAISRSLFDTPGANPATNRCDVYDPNCRPRQLFVRPPERSIKKNPLGTPARKLILPRDLNDRSGEPSPILLFPGEPGRLTRSTLTCSDARRVIRYQGYRNIRTIKCGGKYHEFTARRQGAKPLVRLKVRATTGRIIVDGRIR
jgi:hypothetical protein